MKANAGFCASKGTCLQIECLLIGCAQALWFYKSESCLEKMKGAGGGRVNPERGSVGYGEGRIVGREGRFTDCMSRSTHTGAPTPA